MSGEEITTVEAVRLETGLSETFEVIPGELVSAISHATTAVDMLPQELTPEVLQTANKAAKSLHDAIKAIEAHRKTVKRPVIDLGKAIDECAKNAVADAADILSGLKAKIGKIAQAEANRVDEIKKNLSILNNAPRNFIQLGSADIDAKLQQFRVWFDGIKWQEFDKQAGESYGQVMEQIKQLREAAIKREEAEIEAEKQRKLAEDAGRC